MLGCAGSLFDGHGYGHDAGQIGRCDIDAVSIELVIVVRRILHGIEQIDAGRDAVHLGFGIELGHRQVAGFRRVAGSDADELSDRGQSAPQDGDCENHLQKRQTATNWLWAHGKAWPDCRIYTINPPQPRSDRT